MQVVHRASQCVCEVLKYDNRSCMHLVQWREGIDTGEDSWVDFARDRVVHEVHEGGTLLPEAAAEGG